MPPPRQSKFADSYKRKSGGIDKRVLRGVRRSLDRKQSRSEVVGQRRNMDAFAMSPVKESPTKATKPATLVSVSSKAGMLHKQTITTEVS